MKTTLLLLATMALCGCAKSPFNGRWESVTGTSRYQFNSNGECRLLGMEGAGFSCTWKPIDAKNAHIEFQRGASVVEKRATLMLDDMLEVTSPGRDSGMIFTRKTQG